MTPTLEDKLDEIEKNINAFPDGGLSKIELLSVTQALRISIKANEFYASGEHLPGPIQSMAGAGWSEGEKDNRTARQALTEIEKVLK